MQIGRWKHIGCNDCNEAPADLSKLYVAMVTTASSPTKVAHFIGSNHLMDTHLICTSDFCKLLQGLRYIKMETR